MRIRCCVLLAACLASRTAFGQTSTADGLAALARGDDAAAVRILRPLAERSTEPDPIAAFVMATLYRTGRGVSPNSERACGLYMRAASPSSPLAAQALRLANGIHRDHPLMRDLCVAAGRERWVDPPPIRFVLGTNHCVRIDADGFVVGRGDSEKRAPMPLGGIGRVYLPTRLTTLDVSTAAPTRRHFVEFFFWMRARPDRLGPWVLLWTPVEVVGLDTIPALWGAQTLAMTTDERPPGEYAVDGLRALRLNADGDVEWEVYGPFPARGVIPVPEPR